MSNLQTLQSAVTAAILGGDIDIVAKQLYAGKASNTDRFRIFRNNSYASLTECLKTVFPVTVRLSDEHFFAYAAHEFISGQPPSKTRLSSYGAAFPRFLATFPPCRNFPIIAEMAALEWAIAGSLNDAEEAPAPVSLMIDAGADGGKISLQLQPNLRFIVSRWPLLGVWADHKKENSVITGSLKDKVSRLAICRHGEDIQLLELDASRFAFWRTLAKGLAIEAAAKKAFARDPLFDLVQETVALFRSNLIIGISTSAGKETQS
jgi:Putative DNA-binding domain